MSSLNINLTVIGDRSCSTTRTYLEYLLWSGYRIQRLWLIDFGNMSWRTRLRSVLSSLMYSRRKPMLDRQFSEVCRLLQVQAGCTPINYDSAWQPSDYACEVSVFRASGFDDPRLQARMVQAADTAFLYTNGGRVPAQLLDRPDIRVLHIHPGIVPDLRGSDCFLWSADTRRKLGASCFYMSSGIDEGPLILQREFSLPKLPALAPLLERGDEPTAYRALLYAVDPHLRAQLLVDVLRSYSGADLRFLPAHNQMPAGRPAYLWMHPSLRLKVIKEAFL